MCIVMLFLGFIINSRFLTVEWPRNKRTDLLRDLDELFARKDKTCKPVLAGRILGKVRSAALIAPWGIYLSWSLNDLLADSVRASLGRARYRAWWTTGRIHFPKIVLADLTLLQNRLGCWNT